MYWLVPLSLYIHVYNWVPLQHVFVSAYSVIIQGKGVSLPILTSVVEWEGKALRCT